MKVLHVVPTNGLGGVPIVLYDLIRSMPNYEHFVLGEIEHDGLDFRGIAIKVFNVRTRKLSIVTFLKISRIVRKYEISIVHSHGKGPGFYSRSLKLFYNIKIVHTFHGFFNRFKGPLALTYIIVEKLMALLSDSLIALSETERIEVVMALGSNLTRSRLVVVPNFYIRKQIKKSIKLFENKFVVGNIGRMCRQKNQKLILKIAEKFLNDEGVVFVLIGGPSIEDEVYYSEVISEINEKRLKNVLCLGPLDNASKYLGGFNVYLSTSLWEGLPTVILESFDYGIPVIASSCVGNRDLVNDKTGVLVTSDNVDNFVSKIKEIRVMDCYQLQSIKLAQEELLDSEYSIEEVKRSLSQLYG